MGRFDGRKTFLTEKNHTPFAIEGSESVLTCADVNLEATGVAFGQVWQIPSFLVRGIGV